MMASMRFDFTDTTVIVTGQPPRNSRVSASRSTRSSPMRGPAWSNRSPSRSEAVREPHPVGTLRGASRNGGCGLVRGIRRGRLHHGNRPSRRRWHVDAAGPGRGQAIRGRQLNAVGVLVQLAAGSGGKCSGGASACSIAGTPAPRSWRGYLIHQACSRVPVPSASRGGTSDEVAVDAVGRVVNGPQDVGRDSSSALVRRSSRSASRRSSLRMRMSLLTGEGRRWAGRCRGEGALGTTKAPANARLSLKPRKATNPTPYQRVTWSSAAGCTDTA
jgi:hypothetical protein